MSRGTHDLLTLGAVFALSLLVGGVLFLAAFIQ